MKLKIETDRLVIRSIQYGVLDGTIWKLDFTPKFSFHQKVFGSLPSIIM